MNPKPNKKSYTLNRVYPTPLKKNPKKLLGRLGIAYLGFLEPVLELLLIPWEMYNKRKPKDLKDLILFSDSQISVQFEDQPTQYNYSDVKNLKIYFNKNSADMYEEGSITVVSNIHFQYEENTTQFYFENRDTEVILLLKFLYQNNIKFKEYRDGQRTFLLKQPNYKKVQEIKKEYDLEW